MMRLLILLAGLVLVSTVMAEEKPKTIAKQLDKSSPVMMATDAPSDESNDKENDDESKTRAQDYNSSRSNTTSRAETVNARDFAASRGEPAQKPNATRAQDYNSSRSNISTAIELDDDSDGDSIPTDDVCRNAVDNDCTGPTDEEQTLKRPDKAQ
jgi:hypothetical protein